MFSGILGSGLMDAAPLALPGPWNNNGAIAGCVAAWQPKGAASQAASYVNLVNPGTYNASPIVAPAWDSVGGWTGNGTTTYLATGLTPAANWSILVRFSDCSGDTAILAGSEGLGTEAKFVLFARVSTGTARLYRNGTSAGISIASPLVSGVMGFAGPTAYLNGSAEAGTLSDNLSLGLPIYILARNANGTPNGFAAAKIQAIYVYRAILSGANITTITTAMNAL